MSFFGGLFNDVQNALNNFVQQPQNFFSNIGNDIQSGLASAYRETRQGLTNLALYSGAAGQELRSLIYHHQFIPWNQAIKRAEALYPYYNAYSQFVSNIIPIVGTFGHLAAHPNENIWNKISDIGFGIADVVPIFDLAGILGRPIEFGTKIGLAEGGRILESADEALSSLGSDLESGSPNFVKWVTKEGQEIGSGLEKDWSKFLKNVSKWGTRIGLGLGLGGMIIPWLSSLSGGHPYHPSSPSSPSSSSNIPHPSSSSNIPHPSSITTNYPMNLLLSGINNPFQGEQSPANNILQIPQGTISSSLLSSPNSPSSPIMPMPQSNPSQQEIPINLIIIGIIIVIIVIIAIISMR